GPHRERPQDLERRRGADPGAMGSRRGGCGAPEPRGLLRGGGDEEVCGGNRERIPGASGPSVARLARGLRAETAGAAIIAADAASELYLSVTEAKIQR